MEILEQARKLPEPLFSFFWSDEPRFLCEDISFLYGIPEESVGEVSWFVAPLLIKAFPLTNLPNEIHTKLPTLPEGIVFGIAVELNRKLLQRFPEQFPEAKQLLLEWDQKKSKPILSEQDAHKKTLESESWYINWKQTAEKSNSPQSASQEENKPKAEQLPLLDAMGKYPKIGEQIISNDRIVVKGESAPVRGSVRNWLRAYRDVLGVRKHSAMERGQFLFQSDNTRRLPKEERFRLSALLKSLDENAPLDILIDRQEIQFPDSEEIPAPIQSETAPAPQEPPIQTPQAPAPAGPFQPVGNRLRIRSAQPAINTQNQTPENTEFEADSEESKGLSSAVYGNLSETPDQSLGRASEEKTGLHFSSSHILPHEQASALGTHRYKESIPPKNTAQSTPTSNTAIGTSTFSGEGGITENQKEATNNNTPKQTGMPQKNFGNLVNLRDKK